MTLVPLSFSFSFLLALPHCFCPSHLLTPSESVTPLFSTLLSPAFPSYCLAFDPPSIASISAAGTNIIPTPSPTLHPRIHPAPFPHRSYILHQQHHYPFQRQPTSPRPLYCYLANLFFYPLCIEHPATHRSTSVIRSGTPLPPIRNRHHPYSSIIPYLLLLSYSTQEQNNYPRLVYILT